MSSETLLAETNKLLAEYLELKREIQVKHEEADAKFQATMDRSNEAINKKLVELGVPEELAEGNDEDWQVRLGRAESESMRRMKETTARAERFHEDLLAELARQSDLLDRIARKLEAE